MSDLLNDAVKGRDIKLKSAGTAERSFCYITDAVDAFYRVLLTGKKNEAFNIANETESISILELAKAIQSVAASDTKVKTGEDEAPQPGYCSYKRTRLETSRVENLGWKPRVSLEHGISRTLRYFKNSQS